MPDSVRLLKLEPGDSDALLEGTFTIISLLDLGLSYRALSYTWGNPLDEDSQFFEPDNDSKYYFKCAGKRVEILKNLRDALWQHVNLDIFHTSGLTPSASTRRTIVKEVSKLD